MFHKAQQKILSIFGYEIKELQRCWFSKDNLAYGSQQRTTKVESHVLKSKKYTGKGASN